MNRKNEFGAIQYAISLEKEGTKRMELLTMEQGTKLLIAIDTGDTLRSGDYNLRSSFRENVDEETCLIAAPLRNGMPVPLDDRQKLLIRYSVDGADCAFDAYPVETVRVGIRNCWLIRKIDDPRAFTFRRYKRYELVAQVGYVQISKLVAGLDSRFYDVGKTVDISAGGIAMLLNSEVGIGEMLLVNFPPHPKMENSRNFTVRAEVCWIRLSGSKNAKGGFRFVCGLKFQYYIPQDKDYVEAYINALVKERT